MELQQQQQQVVQLEGLENATARTLLGKLINVLLAVMAVLLVFVSTVANCVVPLMKTRSRTLSTLLLVIILAFLWRNWEAMSQYLDRFLLHPRWPAGALLFLSFHEGTGGWEFKDFDSKMETNTASVALSTEGWRDAAQEWWTDKSYNLFISFFFFFSTKEWICLHFDDLFLSTWSCIAEFPIICCWKWCKSCCSLFS